MKKSFLYYGIVWGIMFVAFNVITIMATANTIGFSGTTSGYWVAYAFFNIMMIGNLAVTLWVLTEENAKKLFLGMPMMVYAYIAMVVSMVTSTFFMAVPSMPYWIGVIVDVIILAFYAIAIVNAKAAATIVDEVDQKVKEQTVFIRMLSAEALTLESTAPTDETKALSHKVYEAIRYSDPMSSPALATVEQRMLTQFDDFREAVQAGDTERATDAANALQMTVIERNNKCRVLK